MEVILQKFKVNTVYHAAAYKQVPMVERNVIEGAFNNTLGTAVAALSANKCQVENFVLISTDKAVRPTKKVCGASASSLGSSEGRHVF
jgi:FlaA1/EpsC-like NDP-sugar epimerase